MQEMPADRIVVGLDVDAAAVVGVVVPVEQHRAERGHQPVGDVARAGRGCDRGPPAGRSRAPRRRCASRPSDARRPAAIRASAAPLRATRAAPSAWPCSLRARTGRQAAVHQQIARFPRTRRFRRRRGCRSRGSAGRCRCGRPCTARCCRRSTPDSATDFFGAGLMSVISISYRLPAARWTATGAVSRQSKMPRASMSRPDAIWIDRECQVGQLAGLERRQSLDRRDEAILLSGAITPSARLRNFRM